MEINSANVIGALSVISLVPAVTVAEPLTSTEVLCMQTIAGSNTGTSQAIGGSANNCLDS